MAEKPIRESKSVNIQGKEFIIPVEGSLGLLALGAIGLKAWRRAREKASKKENK